MFYYYTDRDHKEWNDYARRMNGAFVQHVLCNPNIE
jgi:hypothetical protein